MPSYTVASKNRFLRVCIGVQKYMNIHFVIMFCLEKWAEVIKNVLGNVTLAAEGHRSLCHMNALQSYCRLRSAMRGKTSKTEDKFYLCRFLLLCTGNLWHLKIYLCSPGWSFSILLIISHFPCKTVGRQRQGRKTLWQSCFWNPSSNNALTILHLRQYEWQNDLIPTAIATEVC